MRTVVAKWQAMGFRVASVNVLSLALVISVLWFLGNPDQVHACKCAVPGSPSEEFEKFSAVFAGKVISIHHSFDLNAATVSPEDRTTVGFLVSTVWKGTIYEDMYITTPPTGGSCGFSFTKGEEYIVYAYDSAYADGSSYTVSMCSRSALLGQAQVDIDALGAGRAPQAGTGGAPQAEERGYSSRDGQCSSSRDGRGYSSRDGRTVARTATEYGCEYGMGDRSGGCGGGPRNKRGCGVRTCEASVGHALRSPSTGGRISRPSAINAAPLP